MAHNKNRIVSCKITGFSNKGNGTGFQEKADGSTLAVEVPFTMPGDVVDALLLRKRGKTFSSKLQTVTTPSPDRITPKCIHFAVCGGCRLQHVGYAQQLAQKEELVRKCFENSSDDKTDFRPILACQEPWQYRNKMEFSFSSDLAGNRYLGLMMDSSKGRVLNLTECHLVNTWYIDALDVVRKWWKEAGLEAYHMSNDTGSLRTLTLREGQRTGDRMVMLTVSGNPLFALHKSQLESFVAALRASIEPKQPFSKLSIFLRIQQIGKGMSTNFYEMLLYGPDHIREILHINVDADAAPLSLTFDISPSAFFQTNTQQAEKLYSVALNMAQIPKESVVYDLYCGTGTLGICMSSRAKQVIGIDLSPESALDARTNAKKNGCNNVTIIAGAIRHVLPQIREQKLLPMADVVMVDPPRPGLDPEAMLRLIELNSPKILYISCNPITQATNVAELVAHGYRIESIQPVDQFPQTYHVENVVVLVKDRPSVPSEKDL